MTDTNATTALVWFRRDLRLADNPALSAAVERADRIVAVYIHAPDEEGAWASGAASRWWLHHSLVRLEQALRARGLPLTLRRGAALPELLALANEVGASQVYWNRLYEPALVERDTALKARLLEAGLSCESFNGSLLVEPWQIQSSQGAPYKVFTPFWRACAQRVDGLLPPEPAPRRLHGPAQAPASESLESLRLLPEVRWDQGLEATWIPGERGAHARLEAFCRDGLDRYDDGRQRPDLSGSSRLSPHLHFGELSPRQCVAALRNAAHERPSARQPAVVLMRELGWREFAHHLLHHFPATVDAPLDERFGHFGWQSDAGLLRAWQRGRTGYPLVDAGMRELWHTGWMHNRVRMLVASFLTKNLRLSWLDGARWFWDTLVDADLASNTLGWQWTAGCGADAAPYFRIFNPTLQAERHDPDRTYLRRWVPELSRLPDTWIHRPWQAPESELAAASVVLGRDYPRPVVDFSTSRRAALDAYARMREPVARRA